MDSTSDTHIKAKLFIGCLLNGELRMHLSSSEKWNQASLHVKGSETLIKAHFNQNDYIGYFVEQDPLTTCEIKNAERIIRGHLEDFCPKLDTEKIKITIFPVIFIS